MISVCIATYNGEKYIKKQLDSILCQIGENDEIIISDDGSSDNTIKIIKDFNDSRIKIYQVNFRDFKKNFEYAMTKTSGDIIFLSDQDDIWLPYKINDVSTLLGTYSLVVTDSIVVDKDENVIQDSFFSYFHSGKGILKNIIRGSYFGSCMAFRSSLLKYVLPFPKEELILHDLWIGIIAEITGSIYFYKKPCIIYRRHPKAISDISINYFGKNKRSMKVRIKSRLLLSKRIILFYINYKLNLCKKN